MKTLFKSSIIVGSVYAGVFLMSCGNQPDHSAAMENHENKKQVYACPMHPEITGKKGEKCSTCGMDLVPVEKVSGQYAVKLTTSPNIILSGKPAQLIFSFQEDNRNVPLEVSHEMKVHLMAVDEDLSWFRHLHPREHANGTYSITETFPHGGKYLLFTDFKPAGGASIVDKQEIEVKGAAGRKEDLEEKYVSEIDGYEVKLENGNELETNRTQPLKFSITKQGKKLAGKDMDQYLGANAHIVMIGKNDKAYLHIHPMPDENLPVYAETQIENPGTYRIWVQFKINGKVHTADFTVNVGQGNETNDTPHHMH